jgi:hypothetical protein
MPGNRYPAPTPTIMARKIQRDLIIGEVLCTSGFLKRELGSYGRI